MLADLGDLGLPVVPVDPSRLPEPVRGILIDWAQRRNETLRARHEAATAKK